MCALRRAPGLRQTQIYFAGVEAAIREIAGNGQIDTILDNIGLPYSGMNIALSDSATVGPMDGEILIALKEQHTPTAELVARLRRELPDAFPPLQFFFQPADIVDQVLNFGQPAPIDIRVSGPNSDRAYALAAKLAHDLQRVPGIVDSHVFQVPDAPSLNVDVDRALASQLGLEQRATANDVLVTTNSSAQSAPNFWVDPRNQRQLPAGRAVAHLPDRFGPRPVDHAGECRRCQRAARQMLMNVAHFGRGKTPHGAVAAQHPAGVRCGCRCAGPGSLFCRRSDRQSHRSRPPGCQQRRSPLL